MDKEEKRVCANCEHLVLFEDWETNRVEDWYCALEEEDGEKYAKWIEDPGEYYDDDPCPDFEKK